MLGKDASLPVAATDGDWPSAILPCFFPVDLPFVNQEDLIKPHIEIYGLPVSALSEFCSKYNIRVDSLLRAAWTLVIQAYMGSDTASFGHIKSRGENAVFTGYTVKSANPTLLELCCALDGQTSSKVECAIETRKVSGASISSLPFNSVIIVRDSHPETAELLEFDVVVKGLEEVGVVIEFEIVQGMLCISIKGHKLQHIQAKRLAHSVKRALLAITSTPTSPISITSILSSYDLEAIWHWNEELTTSETTREAVEEQAASEGTGNTPAHNKCAAWIVDPRDHDRLSPVGGIGELAIEGSCLSHGCLGLKADAEREMFTNPEWMELGRPQEVFLTGQLAQYSAWGVMKLLGGKKETDAGLSESCTKL